MYHVDKKMITIWMSFPFVQYFKYEMNAQILGTVREMHIG